MKLSELIARLQKIAAVAPGDLPVEVVFENGKHTSEIMGVSAEMGTERADGQTTVLIDLEGSSPQWAPIGQASP